MVEISLGHLTPLLHPVGCLLNAGRIERSHGEFYMYEEGMTPSVVHVIESLDRERLKIGCAIMGNNCWKEGRNLEKMSLTGLNLKQINDFLENGKL